MTVSLAVLPPLGKILWWGVNHITIGRGHSRHFIILADGLRYNYRRLPQAWRWIGEGKQSLKTKPNKTGIADAFSIRLTKWMPIPLPVERGIYVLMSSSKSHQWRAQPVLSPLTPAWKTAASIRELEEAKLTVS